MKPTMNIKIQKPAWSEDKSKYTQYKTVKSPMVLKIATISSSIY